MTRVYHLTSTLAATAAAKQLSLLLPNLGGKHRVGTLGALEPFAAKLNIPVRQFRVRNLLDAAGLKDVRSDIQHFRPTILHAWGASAIRLAAMLRPLLGFRCRFVVTGPTNLPAILLGEHKPFPLPRCVSTGVPVNRDEVRRSFGLADGVKLVAASGNFDPNSGLRDAVWAFDILKYAAPATRLIIVGDGPGRGAVERFQQGLASDDDRVSFAGLRDDAPSVFAAADFFWTTAKSGGFNAAAEAAAAGTPALGFANEDLLGLPVRTVPGGDKPALAKATFALLADPPPRVLPKLAEFAVAPLVSGLMGVYDSPTA